MENLGTLGSKSGTTLYFSIYKVPLSICSCLSLEDISVDSNVDYGSSSQEITEGNNISYWDRDNSCDILQGIGLIPAFVLEKCQRITQRF